MLLKKRGKLRFPETPKSGRFQCMLYRGVDIFFSQIRCAGSGSTPLFRVTKRSEYFGTAISVKSESDGMLGKAGCLRGPPEIIGCGSNLVPVARSRAPRFLARQDNACATVCKRLNYLLLRDGVSIPEIIARRRRNFRRIINLRYNLEAPETSPRRNPFTAAQTNCTIARFE